MKTRAFVLPFILSIAALFLLSCGGAPPQAPFKVVVEDYPNDAGRSAIVKWEHFAGNGVKAYKVMRGTTPDNMKEISQISVEIPAIRDKYIPPDTTDFVDEFNYYLVLEGEKEPFTAHLVRATPQTEDSLRKIGKKVEKIEMEIKSYNEGVKKTVAAYGNFYKLYLDKVKDTELIPVEGYSLTEEAGMPKVVSNGKTPIVSVAVKKSAEEVRLVRSGERMAEATPDMEDFCKKYGEQIRGLVLEDSVRVLVKSINLEYSDEDSLHPDSTYYYKILSVGVNRKKSETEPVSIKPIDDAPTTLPSLYAFLDTVTNALFLNWKTQDEDIQRYVIYISTASDADHTRGRKLLEVAGSWAYRYPAVVKLDGLGTSLEDSIIYIASLDTSGQVAYTELTTIVPTHFDSMPPLPKEIVAGDLENDNGKKLVLRWEPPTVYLGYRVRDPISEAKKLVPKSVDVSSLDYYLVTDGENREIAQFENPNDVPEGAKKIYWLQTPTLREGNKELVVLYDLYANSARKPGYAMLRLDDGEPVVDEDGDGSYIFTDVPIGKHKLTVDFLDENRRAFENPEAHTEMEIDVTADNPEAPIEYPSIYLEVARTSDLDETNLMMFDRVRLLPGMLREYTDPIDTTKEEFKYAVLAWDPSGGISATPIMGPVKRVPNLYHTGKTTVLIATIIFVLAALIMISSAKKGKHLYIRPIAGINHVDEAIGRATEMGRPILYVLGLSTISDIATLAGLTILSRVAKKAAEYQTRLIVPCYNPIVMTIAKETVRSACVDAGRPDMFKESDIFFVTQSQFAYAAAVNGIMLREKTATNFYMGMFFAESLLLPETGSTAGSIQIAGTDAITQLPFFITTCDYTLIGEEFYAASAYLSQNRIQIGTLKAQDVLKAIIAVLIIIGGVCATAGIWEFVNIFHIQI
ncbi:hypothetical protein DRQ19_02030 [bacterium]|nr:MAG: hypothetical protein DRQ19_02030 [bacterium]